MMLRRVAAAILGAIGIGLVALNPPHAGLTTTHAGAGGAGSGYVGPGDIQSFTAWYGFRAYTAAIAAAGTQVLAAVSRASDGHSCNIIVATSGSMGLTSGCTNGGDNAETLATFCNSTTCGGVFKDQAGGLGNLQPPAASTTDITPSCINSLPCFFTNPGGGNAQGILATASYTASASRSSIMLIGQSANDSADIVGSCGLSTCNQPHITSSGTANQYQACNSGCGSSDNFTATNNVFHSFIYNGNTTVNLDGTVTTTAATSPVSQSNFFQMGGAFSTVATSKDVEGGIINGTSISSSTMTSLCQNAQKFYGTGQFGATC